MEKEFLLNFDFDPASLAAPKPDVVASKYLIDPALHRAVEVAILLKQPLLLTGEPGTGKTRLAEKLAADLHEKYPNEYMSQPLKFHTKTVSAYSDLFYFYDALGHFHDAHLPANDGVKIEKLHPSRYIYLQALGQALILSDDALAKEHLELHRPVPQTDGRIPYKVMNDVWDDPTFADKNYGSRNSVVLIDEVDKAPRDFTNDLLNELDRFEFSVKEDAGRRFKKGNKNVFLILTSNSEKNLPDPFLRRCIFYHIRFPEPEQLEQIVLSQVFPGADDDGRQFGGRLGTIVRDYVKWFTDFRASNTERKPATAELISWVQYLKKYIKDGVPVNQVPAHDLIASYSIIAKEQKDMASLTAKRNASKQL